MPGGIPVPLALALLGAWQAPAVPAPDSVAPTVKLCGTFRKSR